MVFDTMVLAFALLRTSAFHEASALALDSVDEIWAPDSLRAELVNTFWQWVGTRTLPLEIAQLALQDADRIVNYYVPTNALWEDALDLAVARKHSPYDTLFVALAASSGVKVVTYDRSLLLKFPEWTISVPNFLGI